MAHRASVSVLFNAESLMELKKQKLLVMLQEAGASAVEAGVDKEVTEESHSAGRSLGHESEEDREEDDLVGMKCRAPLKEVCTHLTEQFLVLLDKLPQLACVKTRLCSPGEERAIIMLSLCIESTPPLGQSLKTVGTLRSVCSSVSHSTLG